MTCFKFTEIENASTKQLGSKNTHHLSDFLLTAATVCSFFYLFTRSGYIKSYDDYNAKITQISYMLTHPEEWVMCEWAEKNWLWSLQNLGPETLDQVSGFFEYCSHYNTQERLLKDLNEAKNGFNEASYVLYQLPLQIITAAVVGVFIPSDQEIFQGFHDAYDYALNFVGVGSDDDDFAFIVK